MKKKIVIAQILGKMNSGGVESIIMNYYRYIDSNLIQFDFIIDKDSPYIPFNEILNLGGRIFLIPSCKHLIGYIRELYKILKSNNYVIVHSHMNALSPISLFVARLAKVPVRIAHSHSTSGRGEFFKNIAKNILRPFSKIFATDYFACSDFAGKWLFGKKAFSNNKIHIIRNAIDINKFLYNEDLRIEIRQELNLSDKYVIGHIGRFVKQKNHNFLIDIFYEIYKVNKQSVLLLIGDGPLKKKIEKKVKDLGLADSVIFLGVVNDAYKYYQAMDVFVLPSFYEGLPLVSIEAQAASLHCIISNNVTDECKITNLAEFCKLKGGYSVWAKKINDYSDLNCRKNMISEIKKSGFDINKSAQELENWYLNSAQQISQ